MTLHSQIAAELADAIQRGVRLRGARTEAAARGVSRKTIVAAYRTLERRGLITISRGRAPVAVGQVIEVSNWNAALKATRFPRRTARFTDPDGNAFYLNS